MYVAMSDGNDVHAQARLPTHTNTYTGIHTYVHTEPLTNPCIIRGACGVTRHFVTEMP